MTFTEQARLVLVKVVKNFEVKVNVQKRAVRVREKTEDRNVRFIHFTLSSVVVIWLILLNDYLVHSC